MASIIALLAWLVCTASVAQSPQRRQVAPVLLDNMDNVKPALRLINESTEIKLLSQALDQGQSRTGAAAERIVLSIPAGNSGQLAYNLPAARVIGELRLTAWVKCNRPGVQLAAIVVLPRTVDPTTQAPRRLLVRSGKTAPEGDWQLLDFDQLAQELPAQARVARAAYGDAIDERGAYVSQLVILAPGGPGLTEVWVDQVAMYGVLDPAEKPLFSPPDGTAAAGTLPSSKPLAAPPMPRIIQWQGEPLEFLQKLGFDAVWMGRPPLADELAAARRLGMLIVCQPPTPDELRRLPLDDRLAPVMAWDLGELVEPHDAELYHRWAQAIELHESVPDRPVLLRSANMAREASRVADIVTIGRPTVGSTLSWSQYGAWLDQQRRLARAGTPLWISVDTHAGNRCLSQRAALRGQEAELIPATFHELSLATTAAFGAGPRGFYFQSQASLVGGDAANQMRSLALELTNLRLGLAEPWLAGGKSATAARSSRPDVTGLVLKVERSHLIVPLRWSRSAASDRQAVAFNLPGVPEASDAYLLSAAGSQRLPARRVTGGLQISVDHLPEDGLLLVTEDGYAYSHIERYLRQHGPRAAQARVELAALRRQQAATALSALQGVDARSELAAVDAQMTAVLETMRRRDYAGAFAIATEAERLLDESLQRVAAVVAPSLPAGSSPLPIDWTTLGELQSIERALSVASPTRQLMPGGDFEDLNSLMHAGWQRVEQPTPGVKTAVRLSPEAPGNGNYCLELEVRSDAPGGAPPPLPAAPVWVTSPPLVVPDRQLIEITGLIRAAEKPLSLADPLLIFDTAGGEEAAIRVSSSPSWTPFRMVRAVQPGTEWRLTVALGGIGRAQVDELTIRYLPLNPPAVAQAPR